MEFPDIGKHCSVSTCNQLDFLPINCDACEKTFCGNHVSYDTHNCGSAYKKNIQVPVCPLCNQVVVTNRGELPDIKVGQHIDNDCKSDPAVSRRKVFSNRCTKKGCKVKELVPVVCEKCHLNFCFSHRFADDHDCQPGARRIPAPARLTTAPSAPSPVSRLTKIFRPNTSASTALQGRFQDEDEALAAALQNSLRTGGDTQPGTVNAALQDTEAADAALAKALHESEREYLSRQNGQPPTSPSTRSSCAIA